MACIDKAIVERARKQLGLIRLSELESLGCSRAHRRRLVRDGWLRPCEGNVFAAGATATDWRSGVLAAVWAAGRGAFASHRTAARLWGFDSCDWDAVDVLVPSTRRVRGLSATVHRTRSLPRPDVTRIGPIPITARIRTLIDLATVADTTAVEAAIDGALRDGSVRRARLARRAEELRGPGRTGPAQVLAHLGAGANAPTESWLEREVLRIFAAAGLRRPVSQLFIGHGATAARVDFTYKDARLVIEVDGHRTHSTRPQRQADAEREARLIAQGWRVVRFTYEDVTERPQYVAATVRQLLGDL